MTATVVLMAALVGCDGYGFSCACSGYYGAPDCYGGFSNCGYSYGWQPYHHYSFWGGPSWYSGYYGGYSGCGDSCGWLPYHHYWNWGWPRYYLGHQTPGAAPAVTAPVISATGRTTGPDLDTPQRVLRVPVKYRVRPAQVTIRTGEAIEWRNDTSHTQLIIADPRKAVDAERVELPNGTQPFDSGEIVPGDRFRHTFDVPGTYVYVCRMRGAEGVAGIVVVKNDGAPGTISGVPGPVLPEVSSDRQPVLTAGTDR